MAIRTLRAPDRLDLDADLVYSSPAALRHIEGAWPRTTRIFPWTVALFLGMVFLVPFNHMTFPLDLPVDATPDRIAMPALMALWLAALAAGGLRTGSPRFGLIGVAMLGFFGVAVISILANADLLQRTAEWELAVKKVATLGGYLALFVLIATSVRPRDLWNLMVLMVALACCMAVGVIWEYRTDFNPFFSYWRDLLPGFVNLLPEAPNPEFGRRSITGPTDHGLAVATMLAIVLPTAVVGLYRDMRRPDRAALWCVAICILLAGSFATLRKSGLVVPAASLIFMVVYWPRQMVTMFPLMLPLLLAIQMAAPGALVSVKAQLIPSQINSVSTQGRTEDYEAVKPDLAAHIVAGRGYGSYEPTRYRYIDNEYLKRLIETGTLGLAAYVLLVLCVVIGGRRAILDRDSSWAAPLLALAAGTVAFAVAGALFDIMFFPQLPYLFATFAGLAVVAITAWRREHPLGELSGTR